MHDRDVRPRRRRDHALADGPGRLVGDHDRGQRARPERGGGAFQVGQHDLQCRREPIGRWLAEADDGRHPGTHDGGDLGTHQIVSLTVSSRRRSACPTITNRQPRSASIGADTSPVCGPASSAWTSWAPHAMPLPLESVPGDLQRGVGGKHEQVAILEVPDEVAQHPQIGVRLAGREMHLPVGADERTHRPRLGHRGRQAARSSMDTNAPGWAGLWLARTRTAGIPGSPSESTTNAASGNASSAVYSFTVTTHVRPAAEAACAPLLESSISPRHASPTTFSRSKARR